MWKTKIYLPLLLIVALAGCQKQAPKIEGFDQAAWISDVNGCKGERSKNVEALLASKEALVGLPDSPLLELLGNPDIAEFYARGKKTLIYYLEPGKECGKAGRVNAFMVEMDGLSRAQRIFVQYR